MNLNFRNLSIKTELISLFILVVLTISLLISMYCQYVVSSKKATLIASIYLIQLKNIWEGC